MGRRLILETKWYPRNIRINKTRFVMHWASNHVLWTALYSVPRNTKIKKHAKWQLHLYPQPIPLKQRVYINFGMWGRVLDILERFRCFEPLGGRKSLSPIDWRYCPYNSVRTIVLHCDKIITTTVTGNCIVHNQRWHTWHEYKRI